MIHQTNSGRALGKDGIPAKIYKAAGPNALKAFHDVLLSVWEEEEMLDDFRDALIVSLYNSREGNLTVGTTGAFPFSLSQGRFLPESCSTDLPQYQSRTSQRHSAVSGLVKYC